MSSDAPTSTLAAYRAGFGATWTSVFSYVLFGTYIGIGALGHDFGFSLAWTVASTLLVWAGPAQVILISALGAGASLIEVAIAVGLSAVRLLPMVVAMLPMIKRPDTRAWKLVLPAHFTAVSLWVEAMRLLPKVPRENRIAFCNGLGSGYGVAATTATITGFQARVSGRLIIGSIATTIGSSRTAESPTAIATSIRLAPVPSVEIRITCAGPAHTSSVHTTVQASENPKSCPSAPMPM